MKLLAIVVTGIALMSGAEMWIVGDRIKNLEAQQTELQQRVDALAAASRMQSEVLMEMTDMIVSLKVGQTVKPKTPPRTYIDPSTGAPFFSPEVH